MYGYYLAESGVQKQIFEFLQRNLEEKTDALHELIEVEGLEPGMTYRFRVLAVGAVGVDGYRRFVFRSRNGHDQFFGSERVVPRVRDNRTGLHHVVTRGRYRCFSLPERDGSARPVLYPDRRD